jgi:hypothetical protein
MAIRTKAGLIAEKIQGNPAVEKSNKVTEATETDKK